MESLNYYTKSESLPNLFSNTFFQDTPNPKGNPKSNPLMEFSKGILMNDG
jgi:hypothetical protein